MSKGFSTKSADYWGVLARGRNYRLIVTARKASYGLQRRAASGWLTERTFPTGAILNAHLSGMADLVSASFLDAARRVPHEPVQSSCFLPPPRASRRVSGGSDRSRQASRRGRS